MGAASFVATNFLGGEASKTFQGRTDLQSYRSYLNVCLNAFPTETGAWTRRSGTRVGEGGGTTRSGMPGRLIKFDFQEDTPYNMEFTDGHLRFWEGADLVTGNDSVGVTSISTANPAVVQTSAAVTWSSNDQAFFSSLGSTSPLLQNRTFILTKVDTTHFSLKDAITGATIDGSTLAWSSTPGATINRALDIATPWPAGIWSSLRSVQTADTAFLLNGAVAPYALTVATPPTPGNFATFSLDAAVFNDGPYLDPFTNGVQANPSAKVGIVTITLTFPTYDATVSYAKGAFVTSSSVNYKSLVDQNVGNTPVSSPSQWVAVNAGTAISPNGFVGTDVGRLVRFFSEPAPWASGTTYAVGNVVSYNPSGLPGDTTYWTSLIGSNTGKQPGLDTVSWTLTPQGAAIWTWGKITSLANVISGTLGGSVNIGDMTGNGGLAAAFDGTLSKGLATSADRNAGASTSNTSYVGKNYSGASAQAIGSVTVYPSNDAGFTQYKYLNFGLFFFLYPSLTINLRAKSTAPASSSDGTLLGSTGVIANTLQPVTIISNDQTTTWNYVWVEIIGETQTVAGSPVSYDVFAAQVLFFNPTSTGTSSNGINVEILGQPLLYTTAIKTWRLGVYSNTTGWPTCGTYHEGRLWLSGAVKNRVDACYANGIVGGTVNFAPTGQYGQVTAAHAISYTFDAPDENPIFWMEPDLQGIICGTQAGEWLVQPPTAGSLSPLNIAARRVTKIGAANIEPRRTEHTTVFVQKYRRKIMEYFADVYSGKFTAPHLSFSAKHLTSGFIDEIAYQQELAPIVWSRVAGALRGCTYKRDTLTTAQGPTIAGWHRHELGSDRVIESLCVGPSVGGSLDSLAMVTNDEATGIRHVEIMADMFDEADDPADGWFLDDAVEPSSTTVLTAYTDAPLGGLKLNGLWHLNGETVTVTAGGLDCGEWPVSNGSCSVSFGDGISGGTGNGLFTATYAASGVQIIAGFTYTSDGQIVRPASAQESGARNGPAFGKVRRLQKYVIEVVQTAALSIGTVFSKLRPCSFREGAGAAKGPLDVSSGIFKDTLEDDNSLDGMLCWRVTRPRPATIVAAGAFVHAQDE